VFCGLRGDQVCPHRLGAPCTRRLSPWSCCARALLQPAAPADDVASSVCTVRGWLVCAASRPRTGQALLSRGCHERQQARAPCACHLGLLRTSLHICRHHFDVLQIVCVHHIDILALDTHAPGPLTAQRHA
jgi:hypothetical protein